MNLHCFSRGASCLFFLLLLFSLAEKATAQTPARQWSYWDTYADYSLRNLSWHLGIGTVSIASDYAEPHNLKHQNYLMNGQIQAGLTHRFTNFLNMRAEATLYRYVVYPDTAKRYWWNNHEGAKAVNVDAYLALEHDLFSRELVDAGSQRWNLHVFAGIGATYISPTDLAGDTLLGGQRNTLHALPQRVYGYPRLVRILVGGLGGRCFFNNQMALVLEGSYRMTNTDFLDGAINNATGELSSRDGYFILSAKFQYTFTSTRGTFNYKRYRKRR